MMVGYACRRVVSFAVHFLPCVVLIVACVHQARAGIVAVSGVTLLAAPPAGGVHPGIQQPTILPLFFPEVIGGQVTTVGGLPVDHDGTDIAPTLVQSSSVVDASLLAGVIPTGAAFDSYLLHFDPGNTSFPSDANFYVVVSVEFSTKILGVQLLSSSDNQLEKPAGLSYVGTLEAGDAEILANGGPPAAYYPSSASFRGLEEDSLGIDLVGKRISFAGKAFGTEIDQVRIIVATVPEPQVVQIICAGLMVIGAFATRSRYTGSSDARARVIAAQRG